MVFEIIRVARHEEIEQTHFGVAGIGGSDFLWVENSQQAPVHPIASFSSLPVLRVLMAPTT